MKSKLVSAAVVCLLIVLTSGWLAAQEEGMVFLRESALEKVFKGVTTLREINKVTFVA